MYSQFHQPANFSGTQFHQLAIFYMAKFHQQAEFYNTQFHQQAHFSGTQFHQQVDFMKSQFHQQAVFCGTGFHLQADFLETQFHQQTNFRGVKIYRKLRFISATYGVFLDLIDLGLIEFREKGKLFFEKVNLSKASFLDTDLTNVVFRDVKWFEPPKEKWYKLIFKPKRAWSLWDEFRTLNNGQRDYSKIAENYSQLVINYEKKRDFPTAEQFHIGEMECRRKQKGRFNEYSLYQLFSNYGTSYWQAFIVLCLMLFAFTGVFLISGFKVVDEQPIDYNFGWGYASWPDIKEAFRFTLSILPFQRGMHYELYGLLTEIWKVIAVLVFSSQFALVLLAVRRRFKR